MKLSEPVEVWAYDKLKGTYTPQSTVIPEWEKYGFPQQLWEALDSVSKSKIIARKQI